MEFMQHNNCIGIHIQETFAALTAKTACLILRIGLTEHTYVHMPAIQNE